MTGLPKTIRQGLPKDEADAMVKTLTVTGAKANAWIVPTGPDGSFSSSYTPFTDGTYTFVASFGGEPGYLPSSSPPCSVMVITP